MKVSEFYSKFIFPPGSRFKPYEHQALMWEKFFINSSKGEPILLRAPTGSGKTEAIIAPFLEQFVEEKFVVAPRLIYVLPMRALANQIFERIKGYAARVSPKILVELQHGAKPNEPFFMADVVVTTLDQFIYAYARASSQVGRHLEQPAGSIANSIVVFDEAHMYREGLTFSLMRAMFEILYRSRVPFVVMTATMPKSLENDLFEKIEKQQIIVSIFEKSQTIKVNVKPLIEQRKIMSNGKLSDEVLELVDGHDKVLIIANTVSRAVQIYNALKKSGYSYPKEIVLLHSRFAFRDRETHEKQAINMLGRNGCGGIVVSTQVLEAGMDISADLLITEIAPADSLVQRSGRCARFEGEQGEIVIFDVENDAPYFEVDGFKPIDRTRMLLTSMENIDFSDFAKICSFVDGMEYHTDDVAARDSLFDLYEQVLYADDRPDNISVREGKPVYLIVSDLFDKSDKPTIPSQVGVNLFSMDVKTLKGLELELYSVAQNEKGYWDFAKGKKTIPSENALPFGYYLISSNSYSSEIGLIAPKKEVKR